MQAVKEAILNTYPKSEVRPDGQVVKVNFSDGIKFEILPAFQHLDFFGVWNGLYDYPDSNMGGRWLSTNPKAEQEAMKQKNRESNGLLFDTCRHMRQIRDSHFRSYHLPGIVIDSFAFHYIGSWYWPNPGEDSTQPSGTYEKNLYYTCPSTTFTLTAPGSGMYVDTSECIDVLNQVLKYMSKE